MCPMSNARLNLVVLYTGDIEKSRQFYEAIGLAFVREQHACELGDIVLELYPSRTAERARRVGDLFGHWAFASHRSKRSHSG